MSVISFSTKKNVNETSTIITGCLKPTLMFKLYPLVVIARQTFEDIEQPRHVMYIVSSSSGLRSRKGLLRRITSTIDTPESNRCLKCHPLT